MKEVYLFATNIPQEVEDIIDSLAISDFPNEDIEKGYQLGVKNTLSVLTQFLTQNSEDGVVFYDPNAEVMEEFIIEDFLEEYGVEIDD